MGLELVEVEAWMRSMSGGLEARRWIVAQLRDPPCDELIRGEFRGQHRLGIQAYSCNSIWAI